MPKPQCLIDIDLANALNRLLYKAMDKKKGHGNPRFKCRWCGKPVTAVLAAKPGLTPKKAAFRHVGKDADKECGNPNDAKRPR